jgi:hypothetical protein
MALRMLHLVFLGLLLLLSSLRAAMDVELLALHHEKSLPVRLS